MGYNYDEARKKISIFLHTYGHLEKKKLVDRAIDENLYFKSAGRDDIYNSLMKFKEYHKIKITEPIKPEKPEPKKQVVQEDSDFLALIDKLLFAYGFLPMVAVLEEYDNRQDMDACKTIYRGIVNLSYNIGYLLPPNYDLYAIRYMKANFKELGLTGNVAELNNPYYVSMVVAEIDNFKAFQKLSVFNKALKKGLEFNPKIKKET